MLGEMESHSIHVQQQNQGISSLLGQVERLLKAALQSSRSKHPVAYWQQPQAKSLHFECASVQEMHYNMKAHKSTTSKATNTQRLCLIKHKWG